MFDSNSADARATPAPLTPRARASRIVDAREVMRTRELTWEQPVLGASFAETARVLNTRSWVRILHATVSIACSAVAATRQVALVCKDPTATRITWAALPNSSVIASSVVAISFVPGASSTTGVVNGGFLTAGCGMLWVPPGYKVGVWVVNVDPGDLLSQIGMQLLDVERPPVRTV